MRFEGLGAANPKGADVAAHVTPIWTGATLSSALGLGRPCAWSAILERNGSVMDHAMKKGLGAALATGRCGGCGSGAAARAWFAGDRCGCGWAPGQAAATASPPATRALAASAPPPADDERSKLLGGLGLTEEDVAAAEAAANVDAFGITPEDYAAAQAAGRL